MNVKWGDDESCWLRGDKIWAERPGQKQMGQRQWLMWSCPFWCLKRDTFQTSVIRNSVVKLSSFLLVPTSQTSFGLVS